MTFERFEQLSVPICAWGRKMFGARNGPVEACLGLVEEIGELARPGLKAWQGIRGTAAEHEAAERDALADCAIYFANLWGRRGEAGQGPPQAVRVFALARRVADLSGRPALISADEAEGLLLELNRYAEARGWDLGELVERTWARVEKRDWLANPVDAADIAEAAEEAGRGRLACDAGGDCPCTPSTGCRGLPAAGDDCPDGPPPGSTGHPALLSRRIDAFMELYPALDHVDALEAACGEIRAARAATD